ncbi:DUF6766 family protein [uncultured Chitinophaga sp.]|jgi:hypothetical protein|uniref:DUF6766 family protein n=1 Tax=uncultured Chitinophaga sp. TaxID=339340 RepID=UPI00260FD7D4|nr:DUF6766 family protein [uncultured Chitinophaga sp.]
MNNDDDKHPRHGFFYRNGLTLTFLLLLILSLGGQAYTGWLEHNEELSEKGGAAISFLPYLVSNHFLEATFENWESEFLQMVSFVCLTIWLRQKGSAESKDLDKPEEVDREPQPHPGAPWPVKKGGLILALYKRSLSLVFLLLFMVSFVLHFKGSRGDYNVEQRAMHKPSASVGEYLLNKRFWFESFQNWQSEFMSVAAIVFLTIYLRQQGSSQSKPVDAPHSQTGE